MPRITAPFVILASLLVVLVFAGPAQATKVFGIESFSNTLTNEKGEPVSQAGAHPYALTTTFAFNHKVVEERYFPEVEEVIPTEVTIHGEPKNVAVNLPRGTVVDPLATPRCTEPELESGSCPNESAVGTLVVYVKGPPYRAAAALYNMMPQTGVPGQFAANVAGLGIVVHIDGRVRSEGDYGLSGEASSLELQYPIYAIAPTFWGDPSDPSHNAQRGHCYAKEGHPQCPVPAIETAFLTMPTACAGQPLVSSLNVDSWQEPAVYDTALSHSPAVSGCGALSPFEPSIEATPENAENGVSLAPVKSSDSPTGLSFELHVNQEDKLATGKDATPDLKNAVVALPAGLTADPSFAEGLVGCTPAQIGLKAPADERQAIVQPAGTQTFTLGFAGQSTPALMALRVSPSPTEIEKAKEELQQALEALPAIGQGNVAVSADSGNWEVTFEGALAGREVGSLDGEVLTPAAESLAISTTQVGGALMFSEEVENPTTEGLEDTDCPHASKIGNVEVKTPLLEKPLPGSVYLAQPFENVAAFGDAAHPGGSLLALYLVVEDPERGIVVKLAGHVEVGGEEGGGMGLAQGQIRATFDENPQLPVEDVAFHSELTLANHEGLFGGTRAPLTTPATCGSYQTSSELTPWSSPESGPPALKSSLFEITEGPGGAACAHTPAEEPNKPAFEAGTFTPVAGTYSPFVFTLTREDGSQAIRAAEGTGPPGLTGKIAGIEQCPQGDIEAAEHRSHEGEGKLEQEHPSCPAGSEIGTATVGVGSGAPFYVKDGGERFSGRAYLAGPYKGAPFSAVFIAPAVAGPFDLGVVVVRVALYINPETAQFTVKSDLLPSSLDGIPLEIRSITAEATRPQFILNPTSCNKMAVSGTIFGESSPTSLSEAPVSSSFQVGGCNGLKFAPQFSASTQSKTSKADGASLTTKFSYPAPFTSYANIAKVKVELPKQLPSRLTTLQKACTAKVFEADPASCPAASVVGTVRASTPLLASPLTGPAYFVSRGNEAFPQLIVVLQGENGLVIDLVGNTFISKSGITSTTFAHVPDVPASSFELTLPEGKYSALAANTSLCPAASQLVIPTEIVAQNGAVIHQSTKIEVEGCSKTLRLVSKKLGPAGKTLTLSVEVPAAGKLTASGRGLKSTSKTATARQIVSLSISLAKGNAAKIAKHKSVKVKVSLSFAPSSGKKLTTSVAATYKGKAKGGDKK